jgi:hypothetical protein
MALLLACALLAISAGFTAVWYWLAMRHNRRRALYVLRWIEGAIGPQGQTTGLSWIAHSRFKVPLRLRCGLFHRAWMTVDFRPCEYPLRWLVNKLSGAREVVTFYADLDLPPNFSLHVHNFRWCAQSTRTAGSAGSGVEQCGRFVITTRMDWQREVSSAMTSLTRCENRDFIEINFQRRSPHFAATLPLEALAPGSPVRQCMLETMREVAASSSTSLS